jgi:hypothetical protein
MSDTQTQNHTHTLPTTGLFITIAILIAVTTLGFTLWQLFGKALQPVVYES